jgi:uncharacterized protein (TIGR02001 family)
MKHWKLALCAAVASLGMASAAYAEDAAAPTLAFNFGIANEYSFRGLSQTRKDIQVFGGADLTYGKFYAGTWISNIDFGTVTPDAELDVYGGYKPTLGPVTLDLGVIGYLYPGGPDVGVGTWNYVEFKVGASIPVGKGTLGATVYHSPEFPLDFGQATYVEANGSYPITDKLSVSGAVGYQDLDEDKWGITGYTTGNIGLTYAITPHLSVDARGVFNSGSAKDFFGTSRSTPFNARDKFIATAKVTF